MRPIVAGVRLGEPERAVGALRDAGRARSRPSADGNSVMLPLGVMRPIMFAGRIGVPEVAVGADRDLVGSPGVVTGYSVTSPPW